ncbi:MAG: hypothetical protein II816_06370, partial [Elusimicrobia bacterium]|nr:hypothetical protein [Elusimicrobiota bacterium]
MYENKDIMQNKISEVNGYLNDAKKIVYNFGLKALDKLVEAHNDGIISVEKYYSILLKFAKKKQIPYYRYGTIARYLALQKKYGKINSKKLNSQISSIDRSLSGKMEYTQYSKLKQLSQNFPLEYCKQLRANLRTFDVQEEYNEFYKFCDYLEETNKINLQNLLSEGNSVLRDLYSAYSITLAQQHLTFLSDYTERLSACFTNEITSSDYQYISDNFKKYCILSENFVPYTDIVQIKMWYKFVDKFYSNNEKRNKLFLENIYKKKINEEDLNKQIVIKNENRLPFEEILNITKQPIDIVITGGYHSRGMKSLMEDIDVNYAIIMPNIRSANIEESKNKFYADFMKQASILNNTYNKLVLSGNLGENWADPLKSTVDFFLNYDLLQEIYKYYDNKELSKETVASIQEYIEDKFSDKEYKSVLEDISVNEKGDFILKFLSNGKIRVFTVSKEKEVKGKIATRKKGFPFSSILSAFIYGFTLVFGLAFGTIGGGGYAHLRARVSGQEGDDIVEPLKSSDEQNGLVNNGAKTSINGEITFVGTTFGKDADVSLYGNILLNRVVVGEGNKLRVVSSPKTTIIIEDIDLTDIGELNIDIQAEGEFKVVREDGIIKIYKILKTDFSNHNKQNFELVSVLNKGEIVVSSETEWEIKNKYPIIVLYEQN